MSYDEIVTHKSNPCVVPIVEVKQKKPASQDLGDEEVGQTQV